MGLVLLIVIWLITFVSSYFFIAKTWWLPTGASAAAAGIDHHFATTYAVMGIVFVAAQVTLGLFAWKYRDRGSSSSASAHYSHGNNRLEIIWTVLTFVLFVGLTLMSGSIWAAERFRPAEAGAVQVEVTGMQFQWYFRYPGPDGKFGATIVAVGAVGMGRDQRLRHRPIHGAVGFHPDGDTTPRRIFRLQFGAAARRAGRSLGLMHDDIAPGMGLRNVAPRRQPDHLQAGHVRRA